MTHFDFPKYEIDEFQKLISESLDNPFPIFIGCNNISLIIKTALKATKSTTTIFSKGHNVFYQPNPDFYSKMEITEFMTKENYKQQFEDYCNYFDKHNQALINRVNKKLYNYSKNQELSIWTDYPTNIKMILIIENFNFWDLNSQSIMAQLSENNKNILVIGQLRSDFDFAMHHIDDGIRTGKGGGRFCRLE